MKQLGYLFLISLNTFAAVFILTEQPLTALNIAIAISAALVYLKSDTDKKT